MLAQKQNNQCSHPEKGIQTPSFKGMNHFPTGAGKTTPQGMQSVAQLQYKRFIQLIACNISLSGSAHFWFSFVTLCEVCASSYLLSILSTKNNSAHFKTTSATLFHALKALHLHLNAAGSFGQLCKCVTGPRNNLFVLEPFVIRVLPSQD